jgi:hypothetical protein
MHQEPTRSSASPPARGFLDGLGPRGQRRSEPRIAIAVAGAGCALAVLGALIISIDSLDGDGDGLNRWPGVLLSLALVIAGMVALSKAPETPIGTAGVVAAALGLPAFMVFVTLSETDLPPYDTTAVLVISTVAWVVAWAVGPGRGHPFFLGAGLLGAWWSALELIEGLFSAPFTIVGAFFDAFSEPFAPGADPFDPGFDGTFGPGSFVEPSVPDATTVGLISLLFGIAYLVVGRRLDRAGRFGVGTPFAVATLPCLLLAVTSLADDLDVGGTGALLISLGALLAWHGATVGRRLTTWVGGAGVAIGVATLLSDVSDSALVIGMLYLAAGIGTVAVAHAVGQALSEPAETVPGPSVLRSGSGATAPPPPGAPPGPPAGQAAGASGTNAPPPPPAPPTAPPPGPPAGPPSGPPPGAF